MEMNRFKKTIASAVSFLIMVMAFAVISVGEAEGKVKARFDHSYLPPGNAAKIRRPAKTTAAKVGIRKTARVIDRDGKFTGTRSSRRANLLPYLEQDNIYQ
jgi:hypothetical protein